MISHSERLMIKVITGLERYCRIGANIFGLRAVVQDKDRTSIAKPRDSAQRNPC